MLALALAMVEGPEEQSKFRALAARYERLMFHVARQILPNEQDAEDAVHQAFLALAEHFDRLSRLPRQQLEAYLVVVTERKCIDLLRQQSRRTGVPFDEAMAAVTPPCGSPVANAMGHLSPRYREALLLRYGCGYSVGETAKLLEVSYAAGQKLLQRAKEALRAELEKEEVEV